MQPILNLKCFNGTSRKTPALLKVKCIKGLNELLFTMPIHNMQIFKVSPFFKQQNSLTFVLLLLAAYHKNLHVVYCPNKNKHSI